MSIDFYTTFITIKLFLKRVLQAKAEQKLKSRFSPSEIASQMVLMPGLELQQLIGRGNGWNPFGKGCCSQKKVAKVIKETVASQEAQDLFIREIMITAWNIQISLQSTWKNSS